MTYEEAIKALQYLIGGESEQYPPDYDIPIRKAIEALERQVPKKVIETDWRGYFNCPCCNVRIENRGIYQGFILKRCKECGQLLDWSDIE